MWLLHTGRGWIIGPIVAPPPAPRQAHQSWQITPDTQSPHQTRREEVVLSIFKHLDLGN